MSAEVVGLALLLAGLLLLVGKFVRVGSRITQKLFLPSSIIAGGIALLLGPDVLGNVAGAVGFDGFADGGLFGEDVLEVWESLPDLLISVVFATLFLGTRIPKVTEVGHLAGPQLSLGITMGAGQYVVGILLGILVLAPFFGMNPMAGALIEVGFEGGHGTAAGLGDTFADLGFPEGEDLALGLATIGIVAGVMIGVAMINWAVRTGRTGLLEDDAKASLAEQRGLFEKENQRPAATMTVRPASIEPLAIHFAIVAVAILIGQGFLSGLQAMEQALWVDQVELFEYVPLFPLAMLGGVVVQKFIDRYDQRGVVDRLMMVRIQGLALDVLIVTALATLSLEVIAENWAPFLILAAAGILWNVAIFLFFARRIIPEWWFERAIGDLGQSMGVTATGLILMRVVDPDGRTPALEAFGYKQLGFEPFLGGGLITATSIPLIAQFGPVPFLIAMTILTVLALGFGLGYFGRKDPDPEIMKPKEVGYD
jgi:glutamate:Na+ symporter, ESS family